MKEGNSADTNSSQEVNLKLFFRKVYKHKLLCLISIGICVMIAILYISMATPVYEVSTSILIDPSGRNRDLGQNKYVEGGVSLIEMEKNLYNEIGIIKSFSLVNQTVEDLKFDVTYHAGNWLKIREYYGFFPFEISLQEKQPQLFNIPFQIKILPDNRFRLSIEASEFIVSNPVNGSNHEVKKDFNFSQEYFFGQQVRHDYFNFVVKKPNYNIDPEAFSEQDLTFIIHDPNDVTNNYLDKLSVQNIDIQASIFKLVTEGTVVHKEVEFLKKLTENYIQNELISRNKIALSKESFIRKQLNIITDSLLKVELDLERFKKNKNAVNLGITATNALGQTQNLQVDKAKIELNIEYYNSLIQHVENNSTSEDFNVPTSIGINDPLINANISELQRLYAEKSRKKFYVTSSNQEMNILEGQIKEATGLLLRNLRNAIQSSEMALQGVRSQLSGYQGVISTLPTREKQLLSIERQSALYENLYNYLSQELAKTGIARADSISDTRVLDEARMVGDAPVAPKKMLILVLAMTIGIIIPLIWIIWFSSTNTIEDMRQIIEHTDIPVITSIAHHNLDPKINNDVNPNGKEKTSTKTSSPKLKSVNSKKGANSEGPGSVSKITHKDTSLWKVKESFRDLYANLNIVDQNKGCTVLGITSIMPDEGKTFCAINLAITLAEADNKTIIIDADLRNASLVNEIDKIKGKGLSNYLKGNLKQIDDIIYPHDTLSNLQFIPTAIEDANIHGLLSSVQLQSLIAQLKERYDYIIIDTPAVGLVSDFLLFSDMIDINLFVVRRKIAKISFLRDFEKLIRRGKKKKSYIIFNDTLDRDYKYGYGQKYGANIEPQLINDSLSVIGHDS